MNGSLKQRRDSHVSRTSEKEEVPVRTVGKLIASEEAAVGSVSWALYLRYFKSVGVSYIMIVILFNIVSQTAAVLTNCKSFTSFIVVGIIRKSLSHYESILIKLINHLSKIFSVWLVLWTQDERAITETFWRDLYVGIYASFGVLQGKRKIPWSLRVFRV